MWVMLGGMGSKKLIERILVPTDLSRDQYEFLDYSIALAGQLGAEALFFSVIDSPTMVRLIERHPSVQKGSKEGFQERLLADANLLLRRMVDRASSEGVAATGHAILSENPAEEIIREIHKRKADLVLVGVEGHPSVLRFFIGNSTEDLMARAPCPVLTYRSQKI